MLSVRPFRGMLLSDVCFSPQCKPEVGRQPVCVGMHHHGTTQHCLRWWHFLSWSVLRRRLSFQATKGKEKAVVRLAWDELLTHTNAHLTVLTFICHFEALIRNCGRLQGHGPAQTIFSRSSSACSQIDRKLGKNGCVLEGCEDKGTLCHSKIVNKRTRSS